MINQAYTILHTLILPPQATPTYSTPSMHCVSSNLYRGDEVVYRIVGFEVDPRSVSIESLQLKTDKEAAPISGKEVEPGAQCIFPKDVKVAELHKSESE